MAKHNTSFTDVNAPAFGTGHASTINTADDARFHDNGHDVQMQQHLSREMDTSDAEAVGNNATITDSTNEVDMMDLENNYGEPHQRGQAPYFTNPHIDPTLGGNLNDHMANVSLQTNAEGASATQPYSGDVSSEEITPSKFKRTPVRRGANAKKQQQIEIEASDEQDDDDDVEADANVDDDNDDDFAPDLTVAKKTRTPKSTGKRKAAAPRKTKNTTKTPTKPSKPRKSAGKSKSEVPFNRQRRAPKNGIMEGRVIPRSYEECDEADKSLIDLRDKEQKTWKEIRQAWEELTGQKTGNSTLPNRYERLKDNFSIIKEEDRPRLLEAKDEVEREMAEKKWTLIADKVKASGGDQYTADNLQRQYKKLMLKEGLRPPPGIVDHDFRIAVSDDDVDGEDD